VVWLRSLGLGKYEAIFRENDIDETVLPSLTHENLKELGVASFGHRVKLLDAIAALRNDASGKAPSVDAANMSGGPSLKVPSMSVDLTLPAGEKIVLVLEAIGDDKIRVNSSSFDHPLTILDDQAKKGRTMRSAYWLNHDPSGLVEADYGPATIAEWGRHLWRHRCSSLLILAKKTLNSIGWCLAGLRDRR
jgi:SAM domain (Sterile alpha motif)